MENPITKVGVFVSNGVLSEIHLILTSTRASNNGNEIHNENGDGANEERHGTVIFISKDTREYIEMTLAELQQFLDKFEEGDFVRLAEHPVTSDEMKLYLHDCGECYTLQFRNKRVPFDADIILKLTYIEEIMKSFVEHDDESASDSE